MASDLLVFEKGHIQKLPMTWKEWEERETTPPQSTATRAEERLRIENELQAILGELCILKKGDQEYTNLDKKFYELSKALKELT